MKYFTHLVCSGSAIRSLCLLGMFRYIYFNKLEEHIKNVAGTSMGAFFCLAFPWRYNLSASILALIKGYSSKVK